MWKTWVQSLDWEDPLEEGMATHSSILAWEIPWTEEPGGLQFMGLQRVRQDWATNTNPFHTSQAVLYITRGTLHNKRGFNIRFLSPKKALKNLSCNLVYRWMGTSPFPKSLSRIYISLILFFFFFFFQFFKILFWQHCTASGILSYQTRDRTYAPCSGSSDLITAGPLLIFWCVDVRCWEVLKHKILGVPKSFREMVWSKEVLYSTVVKNTEWVFQRETSKKLLLLLYVRIVPISVR